MVVHLGLAASLPYRAVSQVGAFGSSHVFLFVVLLKEYVQPCEPAEPSHASRTASDGRSASRSFSSGWPFLVAYSAKLRAAPYPISSGSGSFLGPSPGAAGLRFLLFLKLDKVAQSQSAPRRPMENMEHGEEELPGHRES